MARRWKVRKRDGAWQAFDPDGLLRYAASEWRLVMAFVAMGAQQRAVNEIVRFVWTVDNPDADWWKK